MNKGIAYAIFNDIKSEKYTPIEKVIAINEILGMETHNSVTKEKIIDAFRWFCDSEEIEQPKKDWIPIEKELPTKHDDYFVTVKKISNGKVEYFTAIDTFEPQTNGWYMNIDIPNLKREVVAWQPKCFPKPYERMTEREGKCAFEEQFPRGDAYICKKTALICTAEKLKYCKHKQPYKKEGARLSNRPPPRHRFRCSACPAAPVPVALLFV